MLLAYDKTFDALRKDRYAKNWHEKKTSIAGGPGPHWRQREVLARRVLSSQAEVLNRFRNLLMVWLCHRRSG